MQEVTQLVREAAGRRGQLVGSIKGLRSSVRPKSPVEIPHSRLALNWFALVEQAPSPFDDLIAAVSKGSVDMAMQRGTLPPPSRFMVRVSPVDRPHRSTKRNYDYFEELNAQLAAKKEGNSLLSKS
jgi:ABC-type amino acid transport substrate-binding protein